MVDMPPRSRDRIAELLRQAGDPSLAMTDSVLIEAKRGLDDPSSLSQREVQRVCFAVVAMFAARDQS